MKSLRSIVFLFGFLMLFLVGCNQSSGPSASDAIVPSGPDTSAPAVPTAAAFPTVAPAPGVTPAAPVAISIADSTPAVSPDTVSCKEQMWGPWPQADYKDLAVELGGKEVTTTFLMGHVWWMGTSLPITPTDGALWRVSSATKTGPLFNKVGIVFVVPGNLMPEVHFGKGVQGGVGWILCRAKSMEVNKWTVQQVFEEVSQAADAYAADLDAKNVSGTDAQLVYRANFPYAAKFMKELLNCVTPGENGISNCSGTYAPKASEPAAKTDTATKATPTAAPTPASAVSIKAPAAPAKSAAVNCLVPVAEENKDAIAGTKLTAKGPSVVALFNGSKWIVPLPEGQIMVFHTPMSYHIWQLAKGCDTQVGELARNDTIAPDGRKYGLPPEGVDYQVGARG